MADEIWVEGKKEDANNELKQYFYRGICTAFSK